MLRKRFLLSTGAYVVLGMAVGVLWHLVLFHEKYEAMGAFSRGEPIMAFGLLAMVLQGAVFSYFYPLFYRHKGGGHPTVRGIQFTLLMGITVWTVMVFATAAKFEIEPVMDFVVMGTVFQAIQYVITGSAIGWIYGRSPSLTAGSYDT